MRKKIVEFLASYTSPEKAEWMADKFESLKEAQDFIRECISVRKEMKLRSGSRKIFKAEDFDTTAKVEITPELRAKLDDFYGLIPRQAKGNA